MSTVFVWLVHIPLLYVGQYTNRVLSHVPGSPNGSVPFERVAPLLRDKPLGIAAIWGGKRYRYSYRARGSQNYPACRGSNSNRN